MGTKIRLYDGGRVVMEVDTDYQPHSPDELVSLVESLKARGIGTLEVQTSGPFGPLSPANLAAHGMAPPFATLGAHPIQLGGLGGVTGPTGAGPYSIEYAPIGRSSTVVPALSGSPGPTGPRVMGTGATGAGVTGPSGGSARGSMGGSLWTPSMFSFFLRRMSVPARKVIDYLRRIYPNAASFSDFLEQDAIQGPRAVGPIISAIQRMAEQQGLRSPVVVTPEEGRTLYSMDPAFYAAYSGKLANEADNAEMLANEPISGPTGMRGPEMIGVPPAAAGPSGSRAPKR